MEPKANSVLCGVSALRRIGECAPCPSGKSGGLLGMARPANVQRSQRSVRFRSCPATEHFLQWGPLLPDRHFRLWPCVNISLDQPGVLKLISFGKATEGPVRFVFRFERGEECHFTKSRLIGTSDATSTRGAFGFGFSNQRLHRDKTVQSSENCPTEAEISVSFPSTRDEEEERAKPSSGLEPETPSLPWGIPQGAESLGIAPFSAPSLGFRCCPGADRSGQLRANTTPGCWRRCGTKAEPTSGIEPETSSLPWMRSTS